MGSTKISPKNGLGSSGSCSRFFSLTPKARLVFFTYDPKQDLWTFDPSAAENLEFQKFHLPLALPHAHETFKNWAKKEDFPKIVALLDAIKNGKNGETEIWLDSEKCQQVRCEKVVLELQEDGLAYGFIENITTERRIRERYFHEIAYFNERKRDNLLRKAHYDLTTDTLCSFYCRDPGLMPDKKNATFEEVFESLLSMAYTDEDRKTLLEKANRENLIRRYEEGAMQVVLEYRRRTPDGKLLWVSLEIHTYLNPDNGDLECFSYAYDVSNERLNDTVMGMLSEREFDYIGFIYSKDRTFEFLKKSPNIRFPEVRKITSYDQCTSYVLSNFVSETEREQFCNATSLELIVKGLEENDGDFSATYLRSEGNNLYCKELHYCWFEKQEGSILVVRTDVTAAYLRDQAQLARIEGARQEAEKANEAKSSFLSSMSHDIRTPLNGVIGFTELAQKEQDPEVLKDYLGKIDYSAKLLQDLVNDTLDLSRIESGRMSLNAENVNSRDLIAEVVTAMRPSAAIKNITINAEIDSFPSDIVCVDKLKVQKIILNLLSNAIKYTPKGGSVTLKAEVIDPPKEGCNHLLIVSDNGIGMSEEFLKRIYEPFSQEQRPEAGNVGGTGLGMAIVKRIVDLMQGHISVESQIGKGTTFRVELPFMKASKVAEDTRFQKEAVHHFAGKKILLCEDNPINAEIVSILLKDKGIGVTWVDNGKKGYDLYEQSPAKAFDWILMDLRMPIMNGLEATKLIRSSKKEDAKSIPIIALTGDAFAEDVKRCLEAGMNAHLPKPISPDSLYRALSTSLKE